MNYTYLYWLGLFGVNLWLTILYLALIFYNNEYPYISFIAVIGFVIFMYMTLDCDMEAEKARMREEQA